MTGSRKTVINICHFANTPDNGMNIRPYHICKYLIRNGYEAVIVGSGYHHQMLKPKNTTKRVLVEKTEGITYIWLPSRQYDPNRNIERLMNLVMFFARLLALNWDKYIVSEDIRAVIGSSPSIFSGFNAYRIAKRYNAKFLFEVRDIWPLSLADLKNVSRKHPVYIIMKWFERYAYRKANVVVSLLANAKEHMILSGMVESKFKWIPNGIDVEIFDRNKGDPPEELKLIPENKFIVGYIGSLGIINAMEFCIEAASKMREFSDIHFVIVGNGPEKPRLVDQSRKLENITFIDYIKKEAVPEVIKRFDVCLISWRNRRIYEYGVSANKLFDYMYAGKPILQALNSPLNPVAEAGCGITVQAESSDAIADGILTLYNAPSEKLAQMGESGKRYVMENHDYRNLVKEYIKVL